MKSLLNFKSIGQKIVFGFMLVVLLVIALATVNIVSLNKMNMSAEHIVEESLPLLIADEKLAFNLSQRLALVRGYVLYGDQSFKDLFDEYTDESKELQDYILSKSTSNQTEDIINKSVEWRKVVEEVFAQYDKGNREAALNTLKEKAQPIAREVMAYFEEMATHREELLTSNGKTVMKEGNSSIVIVIIFTILVILLSIVIASYTARMIANPIKNVMNRMNLIASGDLSHTPVITKSRDEVGQLVFATNQMNEKIGVLLKQISIVSSSVSSQSEELTQSALEVSEGSEQVAVTMQQLSVGSEVQARSASDLSYTMNSFVAKVHETNETGYQIEQASKNVIFLTGTGNELMESSSNQMEKINQIVHDSYIKVQGLDAQSKEISNLVEVINAISNQTNLLALNAAIEAARAGEHGKGFAVVADEVRKLSEQVAMSVTEITAIVQNIQEEIEIVTNSLQIGYKEVEQGTSQINTTQETFQEIEGAIQNMVENIQSTSENLKLMNSSSIKMSTTIEDIAAITEEAAAGVEQTSASTQQTSSSMEEVAKSSKDLAKLAEELDELVRQFKL
ncbi:methyl-accepting chemotaxis protein [Psychrobacillus sp. L3]|uniref:methyl-accepting chemotaxis protein n=1 Tax=Psychrobacillus sp. L3 TaxID=3236891 RepID=UPI0036F1D275